jgi:hypothetical protein
VYPVQHVVCNMRTGDPIEAAAMKAIGWDISPTHSTVWVPRVKPLGMRIDNVAVPAGGKCFTSVR